MRRVVLVCILHFVLTTFCMAQSMMEDVVVNLSNSFCPYLTTEMRIRMVQLYNEGDTTWTENALHGKSRLALLTDSFAEIQLNSSTTLQIRHIDLENDSSYFFVIKTISLPYKHSIVDVYDRQWRLAIDSNRLMPTAEMMLVREETMTEQEYSHLKNQLFPNLFYAMMQPQGDDISFRPVAPYVTIDRNELEKHLCDFTVSLYQILENKGL